MTNPVDDWLKVQRMLVEEERQLANLAERHAMGALSLEALEQANQKVAGLRLLSQSIFARIANVAPPRAGAFAPPARAVDAQRAAERARHTVLVVDDTPASQYAMVRGLRAAGFRTMEASAGASGLELARFASAVVLDLHLPDIDGWEVCRLLRAHRSTSQVPVIHVSAVYVDKVHEEQSALAGANAFLPGPVHTERLAATLDGML